MIKYRSILKKIYDQSPEQLLPDVENHISTGMILKYMIKCNSCVFYLFFSHPERKNDTLRLVENILN